MSIVRIQETPTLPKTLLRKYSSCGVLVDENTKRHCYPKIKDQLPDHHLFEIPGGEEHKNIATCNLLWRQLTDAKMDRHSVLIVLGGGVLGDLGGFCASTYKRGIEFMLIPTTLLSMADSSVGGKTGVDFGPLKNHIGLFNNPVGTFVASDFLETLPLEELRSGFAEAIKHCLISDKKMWDTVRRKPLDQQDWLKLVRHSLKFKLSIVKKDPLEKGIRKILNYGHTLGHALEGHHLSSGKRLLHGDAIAAGMVIEAFIAVSKGLLKSAEASEIASYMETIFKKIDLPGVRQLLPLVIQDKKNKGNQVLMALPKSIGKAQWDIPVSEREIEAAIAGYGNYQT